MRVIATIKKWYGNETVGEMWTETKSFNIDEPIRNIFDWMHSRTCDYKKNFVLDDLKRMDATITIDQHVEEK